MSYVKDKWASYKAKFSDIEKSFKESLAYLFYYSSYCVCTYVIGLFGAYLIHLFSNSKDADGKMMSLWGNVIEFYGLLIFLYFIFICLLNWGFYHSNIRKWLLMRHRLYALVDNFRTGSGVFEIAIPALICLVIAYLIDFEESYSHKHISLLILMHILIALFSLVFSIWLLHLTDYAKVSQELSREQIKWLYKTTNKLKDSTKLRLDEVRNFQKSLFITQTVFNDQDTLPDREVAAVTLEEILTRLSEYLVEINNDINPDDLNAKNLLKEYGSIVFLYHPDYLPHIAHLYLKNSQLRAFNMPPRRVQLLSRRWTVRGLESEYVVIHDVSELRNEYFELSAIKNNLEVLGESNIILDEDNKKFLTKLAFEPKWKQRSLKKRAIVQVAPDGSLLSINIEEERQFNI
jgi:hypothetical protein